MGLLKIVRVCMPIEGCRRRQNPGFLRGEERSQIRVSVRPDPRLDILGNVEKEDIREALGDGFPGHEDATLGHAALFRERDAYFDATTHTP